MSETLVRLTSRSNCRDKSIFDVITVIIYFYALETRSSATGKAATKPDKRPNLFLPG